MKLNMMMIAIVMAGTSRLAAAQEVTLGGSVKDVLKTAQQASAPAAVAGTPARSQSADAKEFDAFQALFAQKLKDVKVKSTQNAPLHVVDGAKDASARVAGAGKGLRSEEFPIDPLIALLPSFAEKITFKQTGMQKADYSWRRNSWGVCRAWLTCNSGRQISCWAEGWNCDAYSNAGDAANVLCASWDNNGHWSRSWDTCP